MKWCGFPSNFMLGTIEQRARYVVYGLRVEGEIMPFYVGCTRNLLRRLKEHWFDCINGGYLPFRLLHAKERRVRVVTLGAFDDRQQALACEKEMIERIPALTNARTDALRHWLKELEP